MSDKKQQYNGNMAATNQQLQANNEQYVSQLYFTFAPQLANQHIS
jgi:hypothetical protein